MATATTPALDPTIVEQDGNVASTQDTGYGPNNEKLEQLAPDIVAALKTLNEQFRTEGATSTGRIEEIRRIKQARLFWQGKHFGYFWDAKKVDWSRINSQLGDDKNQQSGARYEFVTNLFQSFGLTFTSVITQDVPVVKFYPESAQNPADIATAKAASDISELIEENNNPEDLLGKIGFLLWTDGKLGAYMRYVADGQRFGWNQQPEYTPQPMDVGGGQMLPSLQVKTSRIPKGREIISIVDGLQLNTPVWANEQHEFPYLQWAMEVHLAKLKASYPEAADKITQGGSQGSSEQIARNARMELATGASDNGNRNAGAANNLITYERTWIRPWAFHSIENKTTRDKLLQLFPDGCYVAFAGDVYCESRSESMDAHWKVMHALPGDGQNRPAVGTSTISVNERYNTLANQQAENADYGIPATYADPQVLDFDSLAGQVAEPGAIYPAKARPGQSLANGFYQPPASTMSADAIRHMEALFGPIPQFMSGLFPAIFGGEVGKTAAEYSMAREQALGRIGLVWRRVKEFYADVMLMGVECFRENRTDDTEIPQLGAGGEYEAKMIRMADLKGKVQCRPEADDQYPRMKSQQRAALQQLMAVPDPDVAKILAYGSNPTFIKDTMGLTELEIPGEDSRQKQMREIEVLLQGMPVPIDPLLDDNQTEFEECRRWANSEEGQQARTENPQGFMLLRNHAMQHDMAVKAQMMPALPAAPPQEDVPQ